METIHALDRYLRRNSVLILRICALVESVSVNMRKAEKK